LSDLTIGGSQEDIRGNASKGLSSKKQLLGVERTNMYSSQTSLKSNDSIHSSAETKAGLQGSFLQSPEKYGETFFALLIWKKKQNNFPDLMF